MKPLLHRVVNSGVYQDKNFVNDPFADVINDDEKWDLCDYNYGASSFVMSSRRWAKTCYF